MANFPFQRILCPTPAAGFPAQGYLETLRRAAPAVEVSHVHVGEGPAGEGVRVVHGDPLDELLTCAAEMRADLILLGHRAGRRRRSLSRRLAMKGPCSVWMVPDGSAPRVSRILVPVDFSEPSADALKTAAGIAAAFGAGTTALHVYFNDAAVTYEGHDEVMRDKEKEAFAAFLAPLDLGGVDVTTVWHESSHVADSVLRRAAQAGADLIVMGTRGRSRSAAVLLGSETDRVMENAAIPVLAVKHFGAHIDLIEALLDRRLRKRDEAHFG